MTKRLVGLMASVVLLGSGMAMANDVNKGSQHSKSQTMGSSTGGSGTTQMGEAGMGQKEINGTVVKSSNDMLSLKTDNGIISLKVNKQTQFQDPTVKRAKDLKEGQQVRASFDILGNDNVAKSISLNTGTGGSMMQNDQGINQPADTGGSGLDNQGIKKDQDLGGAGDVGGSSSSGGMGGTGDLGGSSTSKPDNSGSNSGKSF